MMPTEIILVWLPSLLISIISLLVFIYLSFRNRQKIDDLKQQTHDLAQQRVEHFLQREIQATHQRIKLTATSTDASKQSIDKLRLIWLEGELTALIEQGRRRSNYDLLLHAVQPIARMISRPPQPTATTVPIREAAATQLQKVRGMLNSQNETIAQYRKNIAVANRDAKPIPTAGFEKALGNVEQNSVELLATIARLEAELASLQQKFDSAEHTAGAASVRKAGAHSSDVFVVSTPNQQGDRLGAARELLAVTDQAYRQSVVEIGRMREINTQQRQLILHLEKELTLMRKDTEQYEMSSQVLEKLKLQLRDYETCTVILEEESDSLRGKLDALNRTISLEQGANTEAASFSAPAPAVMGPLNRADILPLIAEIMGLEAPQQIAGKLTEWLREQKLSVVVFIRSAFEQIWASSEGGVDAHSRQLLQSIAPDARQPRFDVDEGILFIYPVCRVLIYQNSDLHSHEGELAARLQLIIKIVDYCLTVMQTKQLARTAANNNDLQGQLAGVVAQYKYIAQEHGRIGEKFQAELSHFFSSTQLSDIQHGVVTTMMEDYSAQLEIIGKASKLIYTRLKTIVEDIEPTEALH